jgi:hypothetical protein
MISIICNRSKIPPPTSMHFSTLLATVRVALLRSSWRSYFMRAALFIMRATNSSLVFTFSLYTSLFIHPHRQKSDLYAPTSNSCIFTPIENWTHVYMNLFTRSSPYYHLLKYLLFLLKHPVYHYTQEFREDTIGTGRLGCVILWPAPVVSGKVY